MTPETPLFIDEAQHLDNAGLLIKGLIDGGLPHPIYLTGSSAFHLEARTRESLAGRALRATLHPFSLEEISQDLKQLPPLLQEDETENRARRHMIVGGYPEVWRSNTPEEILLDLVEAFVVRDASHRFKVDDTAAFREFLRLMAGQVGSLTNLTEWASLCGISRHLIERYLDILVQSHLIIALTPFVGGKRAEVTSRPKIYFCDPGLRHVLGAGFHPFDERVDRGAVLESWVAAELAKHLSPLNPTERLAYWRSKSGAEVVFVVKKTVALSASRSKHPRSSAPPSPDPPEASSPPTNLIYSTSSTQG